MTVTDITTGVQTVTATGAVTGSLNTASLSGDYTIKVRVDAMPASETAIVAIEDTANASAFTDAIQVANFHIKGTGNAEGSVFSWPKYMIPGTRFGASNTKLRVNVTSKTSSGNMKLYAWLEQ
jgi:hypothetical protein